MVKAKVFIYQRRFEGFPKATDFQLIEEELRPLQDGEFLAEALFLSVDPYMRIYPSRLPLGSTMMGSQVAVVKESKNPKFPVGAYVEGHFGWRTHTISNGGPEKNGRPAPYVLPDFGNLPLSLGIGTLGRIGNTAYFGFLEICQPKPGETVIVTGAAGAVGNHVGQIAKIKGCKVIGVAGSAEKGKWLTEELGFDHFINYKTDDIDKVLEEIAPEGIDCYFDNVGGEVSSIILRHMNNFGRIAVCGAISVYNETGLAKATVVQMSVVSKQLKMEGFLVDRWLSRWMEGIHQNLQWLKEGKLKYKETVTEGFENMFSAFIDMLKGGNVGKAVVRV